MSTEFYKQHAVWKRYTNFEKIGMKESFLILFNGWLTMDYVLAQGTDEQEVGDFFLTDDFLEQ